MNEELYEALEQEFEKNHVDEDVEDVLLDLAEHMADHINWFKSLTKYLIGILWKDKR